VASVSALNAGVDLILTGYNPDQYFPMLQALLRAEAQGRLKKDALEQTDRPLADVVFEAPTPTAMGRSSCNRAGNSC
jgi:hypothetical protein